MTKERPIPFSTPMIKALLNTKPGAWPAEPIDPALPFKSQTRRLAKFVPLHAGLNMQWSGLEAGYYCTDVPTSGWVLSARRGDGCWEDKTKRLFCRYGVAGDMLWVRETWRPCYCERCNAQFSHGALPIHEAEYRADGDDPHGWRPSMFMPRWASRLLLEVVSVRAERVQAISDEDAIAEGVKYDGEHDWYDNGCVTARGAYKELWDSINAERGFGWDVNPWVWVVEFRRVN